MFASRNLLQIHYWSLAKYLDTSWLNPTDTRLSVILMVQIGYVHLIRVGGCWEHHLEGPRSTLLSVWVGCGLGTLVTVSVPCSFYLALSPYSTSWLPWKEHFAFPALSSIRFTLRASCICTESPQNMSQMESVFFQALDVRYVASNRKADEYNHYTSVWNKLFYIYNFCLGRFKISNEKQQWN